MACRRRHHRRHPAPRGRSCHTCPSPPPRARKRVLCEQQHAAGVRWQQPGSLAAAHRSASYRRYSATPRDTHDRVACSGKCAPPRWCPWCDVVVSAVSLMAGGPTRRGLMILSGRSVVTVRSCYHSHQHRSGPLRHALAATSNEHSQRQQGVLCVRLRVVETQWWVRWADTPAWPVWATTSVSSGCKSSGRCVAAVAPARRCA